MGRATGIGNRPLQLAIAPTTGEAAAAWEYRPPGDVRTLVRLARLPSASARWTAGATISAAQPGSIRPTLGFDDAGTLTVSWYWNGVVQTATRPHRGLFSTAQTLTAAGARLDAPVLAVGARGDAVVAWDRYLDAARTIEATSRTAGNAWALPQQLAPIDTAPNPGPYLSSPSVSVDARGAAITLWGIAGGGDAFRIKTAERPAGGAWSAPLVLEDAHQIEGPPRMTGNPSGAAVAAWVARGVRSAEVIHVSVRSPATGQWSAPLTLSSPTREASSPAIAIDRAGDAAVGWTERLPPDRSLTRVALRPAGASSWQPAQTIAGAGPPFPGTRGPVSALEPSLAIGGGRLVAVWTECAEGIASGRTLGRRCIVRSRSRPLTAR